VRLRLRANIGLDIGTLAEIGPLFKEPDFKQKMKNRNRKVDLQSGIGRPFPFSVHLPDNQMIFGS
jgi:hypothetical protein